MAAVLGAIAGIGAIMSGIYGIFKWIAWKTATTPQEAKQTVDNQVLSEKASVEKTGRPQ